MTTVLDWLGVHPAPAVNFDHGVSEDRRAASQEPFTIARRPSQPPPTACSASIATGV